MVAKFFYDNKLKICLKRAPFQTSSILIFVKSWVESKRTVSKFRTPGSGRVKLGSFMSQSCNDS